MLMLKKAWKERHQSDANDVSAKLPMVLQQNFPPVQN